MTKSPTDTRWPFARHGFSLVEMAFVLVVFGLLAGGLLKGLSAHRDVAKINEAKNQLSIAREAVIGFAIAHGRLPCPALPDATANAESAGVEANACTAECTAGNATCAPEHGVLPWRTLGVAALDPWGNRLTYFADKNFSQGLSTDEIAAGQRSRIMLGSQGRATIQERAGSNMLSEIPLIIVSHGLRAHGAYDGNGSKRPGAAGDEAENADSDLTFIARVPDDTFDDLLTWLPASILKARLAGVGKLP